MSFECDIDLGMSSTYRGLRKELTLWARVRRFPLYGTFELTPYCNLKCPMCYVRLDPASAAKQGKLMTGKQWLEISRQSRDLGLLFLTLSGGEPFLHPDFWEIYNGLTELGILTNIYTNGCLIDEAVVEKLKQNPPHNIKISIYGASNETYEKMCGVKDGFTKVSRAIDLLKEAGLEFYCTTTVVHENAHDLEAMYRFAAEKQIRFFHTIGVANSVRDPLSNPDESRIKMAEQPWTLATLEKERHPQRHLSPFALCAGHRITFFMTWHGHMQFCAFSPKPLIRVGDPVDIRSNWNQLLEEIEKITTPAECETCEHYEFCKRCPGLLASESGDPSVMTKKFCQQAIDLHRLYDRLKAQEAEKAAEEEKN